MPYKQKWFPFPKKDHKSTIQTLLKYYSYSNDDFKSYTIYKPKYEIKKGIPLIKVSNTGDFFKDFRKIIEIHYYNKEKIIAVVKKLEKGSKKEFKKVGLKTRIYK